MTLSGGSKAVKSLKLISLKKPAVQSSMHGGGKAIRAVDGIASQEWRHNSVTRTHNNQGLNWLEIDLQRTYEVNLVHVTIERNRRGNDGTKVIVMNGNDRNLCGRISYEVSSDNCVFLFNCGGTKGDAVRLENPYRGHLGFGEVQVYSASAGTGTAKPKYGYPFRRHVGSSFFLIIFSPFVIIYFQVYS